MKKINKYTCVCSARYFLLIWCDGAVLQRPGHLHCGAEGSWPQPELCAHSVRHCRGEAAPAADGQLLQALLLPGTVPPRCQHQLWLSCQHGHLSPGQGHALATSANGITKFTRPTWTVPQCIKPCLTKGTRLHINLRNFQPMLPEPGNIHL